MHCHFLFELMQLISGPRVESMFSEMGNFLTDQRSRVKMETYNAQHMIKMHFRGDVIEKLHRPDVLCSQVHMGWKLIKNLRGASAKYREICSDPNTTLPSKRKYVEDTNNKEVSAKKRRHDVFPKEWIREKDILTLLWQALFWL